MLNGAENIYAKKVMTILFWDSRLGKRDVTICNP